MFSSRLAPMFGRQLLFDRLLLAAERDERIIAITEGGSAAHGELDEFSDVDAEIVCADDGYETLLGEAKEFATGLGPLLCSYSGEHIGQARVLMCLYGPPLLHVDLTFVSRSDLGSSGEDAIIVWEREPGLLTAATTDPAGSSTTDAQWLEDRFWSWVHNIATKIGRGELFECISGFAYLRDVVLGPMVAVRAGRRPQGSRRLEQYAGDALPLLDRTVAARDRRSCFDALHASIELYRRLRDEAHAPELVRRTQAETTVLAYVSQIEHTASDQP